MKDALRRIVPRKTWEALRQAKIARSIRQFPRKTVEHNYAGHRLKVLIADPLSESWYDKDWPPLPEIELLSRGGLREGGRVFDLGAHQGVVAMLLAKEVGEKGSVLAVEGMPHNCDVAAENAKINQLENVKVIHAVVSDAPGFSTFFDGLNGSVARDGVGQQVKAVTIDELARDHGNPDVVFVDIEGYEIQALHGAHAVLRGKCDWFVEVHVGEGLEVYGGSPQQVFNFFPTDRYNLYVWKLDTEDTPRRWEEYSEVVSHRFALIALHR